MEDEILSILTKLISYPTLSDNPQAITDCYDYIDSQLSFFPFVKKTFLQNGVESRVWSTQPGTTFDYILNAHIDVVPAAPEMFTLTRDGDKLRGRGVSDMKFSVAIFIAVLKNIYLKSQTLPSLAIILTSDEERGGFNGIGYLVEKENYRASKVVIIPDGGDNNHLVEEAKGVIQLEVKASGVSAHASRPWEGDSANDKILTAATAIRQQFPEVKSSSWVDTINIGKIIGGSQANQVSDSASLFLDIRYTSHSKVEDLIAKIESLSTGCQVIKIVSGDAFYVNRQNEYITKFASLLGQSEDLFVKETGASDGRFFTKYNIPVILSKPISGPIHHPDEWISFSSVLNFAKNLQSFFSI